MRVAEARKRITNARAMAARKISDFSKGGSFYARGLASEGYDGGFRDALDDVLLLLNNVEPQREYWKGRG